MALFKILRGNKANLANAEQQDGWAYFTPDTKGFYINANNELLKINDRVEIGTFALTPSMLDKSTTTIDLSLLNLSNVITPNLYYVELDFDVTSEIFTDPEKRFLCMSTLEKANLKYELTDINKITITRCGSYDGNLLDNIPMIIKFIPYEREQ